MARLEKIGEGRETIRGVVFYYDIFLGKKARYSRIEIRPEGNRVILPICLGRKRDRYLKDLIRRKSGWIYRKLNSVPEKNKRSSIKLPNKLKAKYYEQARNIIKKIIHESGLSSQYSFNKIYIRDQKTRWGSCSSKKNLSFNWRIILLSDKLKKYLVFHELVHLSHPNHSQDFWNELEGICSQAKSLDHLLRKRDL